MSEAMKFFNAVPPAAMAAYAAGQERMQAHLARLKVEEASRPTAAAIPPAYPAADDLAAEIEHAYRAQVQLGLPEGTVANLKAKNIKYADMVPTMIEMNARRLAAENPPLHRPTGAGMHIISDERETLAARIVDGLSARLSNTQPTAAGAEFTKMPLSQISELAGKNRLSNVRASGGMHTSSDFSGLLGAAAGKALARSYEVQRSPLVKLCGIDTNVSTFQPVARITIEPGPALEPVNEAGEVQEGTFAAAKETLQLRTFARIFSLSRQAYLSDDLGGFQRMISEWGRVSASVEARIIVEALTSKVMADGKTLFHADHGNLAGSGAAISDTTLEAASLAMSTATSNGHIVGVEPRFLVVPAAKRVAAAKYLTTITPATVDDVNVWSNRLELLVSPHLDASSATAWYLFADPAIAQTLTIGYFNGRVGPTLTSEEGFEQLSMRFRLHFDVGIGIVGSLGGWKNPGA